MSAKQKGELEYVLKIILDLLLLASGELILIASFLTLRGKNLYILVFSYLCEKYELWAKYDIRF
jgi:hypothetical protein